MIRCYLWNKQLWPGVRTDIGWQPHGKGEGAETRTETRTSSQKNGHDVETKRQWSTVAKFTVPLDTEVFKEWLIWKKTQTFFLILKKQKTLKNGYHLKLCWEIFGIIPDSHIIQTKVNTIEYYWF